MQLSQFVFFFFEKLFTMEKLEDKLLCGYQRKIVQPVENSMVEYVFTGYSKPGENYLCEFCGFILNNVDKFNKHLREKHRTSLGMSSVLRVHPTSGSPENMFLGHFPRVSPETLPDDIPRHQCTNVTFASPIIIRHRIYGDICFILIVIGQIFIYFTPLRSMLYKSLLKEYR